MVEIVIKISFLDGQTYELKFEQLHVYQRPTYRDKDRVTHNVYPSEARLRNLTYESELFMDVRCRIFSYDEDTGDEKTLKNELMEKIPIGKVPIMVRSKFCALEGLSDPGNQFFGFMWGKSFFFWNNF